MRTTTRLIISLPVLVTWASLSMGQAPVPAPEASETVQPSAATEESDFPPKKFDPRRYDAIFQKNPFMQEVIPVAEEKPEDPWAEDLTLRAVTRIGGKFVVHLENTKLVADEDPEKRRQAHRRLVEGEASGELRIQSVKPHRDPAQVEVVLVTGSGAAVKTATVKYSDKQLTAKPAAARPAPGQPPVPGQPAPRTTGRPATPSTTPSTTPGKRRVILPPGLPTNSQPQ